ncbi:MAG: DUF559 domain-containing protein [Coriobacteriaceae bacterium]|nr:MAG: DUF559 domain-containing protein [Coriobacteriaceae bacterium]
MTILLSHNTARRYWEFVGAAGKRGLVDGDPVLRAASSRRTAIERCGANLLGDCDERPIWLEQPVDLMVPSGDVRGRLRSVNEHVCSSRLPHSSVCRIGSDLYVTSPELTFVNLGRSMKTSTLSAYAMELCGGYAMTPWTQRGFELRAPLSTSEELGCFTRGCGGMHGCKRALEALRIAGEGSRSPAETLLYLLLCIPRSMFGYGLPKPLLNRRIDISRDAQMRLRTEYVVVDLLFEDERLVVEYDSRSFHNSPVKLDHDDDRREVLQDMGYEVVVVRAERLSNYRWFDDLVRFTIGKRLGIDVPPMDSRFVRGVQNLRDDLRG